MSEDEASSPISRYLETASMTVQWRKSSHSGGANDAACVELAKLPTGIGIRDSKNPAGDHLSVSGGVFVGLVRKIKDGTTVCLSVHG